MELTKKNASIDYLKAMAAVLVVMHHAIVYPHAEDNSLFYQAVLHLITAVHVPLFFVVAGYLCHKQDFKTYLKKKALRILVPFYLFTTLKLCYSLFISSEFAHASSLPEQLYDGYILGNLYWFPYSILLSYCGAVLFWTKRGEEPTGIGRYTLPAAILCLLVLNLLFDFAAKKTIPQFQISKTMFYFLFFLLGMLVRQHQRVLSGFWNRRKTVIGIFCAVLILLVPYGLAAAQYNSDHLSKLALSLPGILILVIISQKLPAGLSLLTMMGRYSLQIMFLDSFWKVVLFAVLQRFVPAQTPVILISIVLNIALSCITCKISEKIPLLRFLMGL